MPRSSAAAANEVTLSVRVPRRRPVTRREPCEGFTLAREYSIPSVEETGRICAGIVWPADCIGDEHVEHLTGKLARSIASRGR